MQDPGSAGIAEYLSAVPFQSGLGGNKDVGAQPGFRDRLAHDLFRAPESIDWRGVDNIDAMREGGTDGCDRLGFVGSTPHPATDGPRADSDRRHLERRAGDAGKFTVHLEGFCLVSHDLFLLSGICVSNADWLIAPTSIGGGGRYGVDARFLRSDQAEGGPIELAVTARDSGDEPAADHVDRRHRGTRLLCFRERQAHILEHEWQDKSGRVRLPGDLVAINL